MKKKIPSGFNGCAPQLKEAVCWNSISERNRE